ncbi:MAG: hypothetical protein ACTH4C_06975 [Psychrobacter celer]|uniref:hypothetical protein n=1 Tax=Psychrobacter TaxID=497 RepID=UPI000CF66020|nr:hypothetical protein [Psychrobacter sp. Marseille-P5312]
MKSTFYTIVALIAFAANSLFCRMALRRADFVFGSTADDLRDSPFERKAISARFEDELNDYHKGFRRIGGDRMSRVRQVAVWLQELS